MSDIDIERLREAARRVEFNYRSGQLSTGVGVLTVLDAARFLVSLADEGGELWQEKPCEKHGRMDNNHCDHGTNGGNEHAGGLCPTSSWCEGGSPCASMAQGGGMTQELHLVTRCKHNNIQGHWWHPDKKVAIGPGAGNEWCGGGSVVVLDPVVLSKAIHDLQQEHGLDTRHDIGLTLLDALTEGKY